MLPRVVPALRRAAWPRRWVAAEHPIDSVTVPVPSTGGAGVFTRRAAVSPEGAPVVVLVHGLGMSGVTFVPLIRALSPHAQVWAPDLPGFGRSSKPEHALDLEELAQALREWVEETGLRPDLFLGHSLGAQVIAELELHRPGTVPAAVFVGPTRDPAARTLAHQAWRMVRDAPREPLALARLAVRDYLRATPSRIVRTMRDAMDTRGDERARALDLPVLVVRGSQDPVVPDAFVRQVVAALPQGELAVVPDAPHGAPFTHATEIAELVLDFVRRHRR